MDNLTDKELIGELQNRGYRTELLFNTEDVSRNLKRINEVRNEYDLGSVELDDQDIEDVLDSIEIEYFIEKIDDRIQKEIRNIIKEKYD